MRTLRALLIVSVVLSVQTLLPAFDADEPRVRYTVTSWTEGDGMPSSYVRAIAQDRDGYLWLATYSGLVRFDGVRFVPWQSRDGSTLPSDDLSALLATDDGSLWVGGFGGVTRIVEGRVDKAASTADGFFNGSVQGLLQDNGGAIWAASQSGVARFDGTRWQRFGGEHGLPERAATRVRQDAAGTVWVGTSVGLHRRTADAATFEAVPGLTFAIEDVALHNSGGLVVPHPTGLFTALEGPIPKPADPVVQRAHGTRLLYDHEGQLWIGTRGHGLVRLRTRNGTAIYDRVTTEDGLSADSVLALFEDREGNIWVGTPFGLNRLSRNTVIPVPMGSEMTGHVRAVIEGDEGTFVATDESLLQFTPAAQIDFEWKKKLPHHTLTALYYDTRSKVLWISTNQGLVRLKSGRLSPFPTPGAGVLSRIRSIAVDTEGRLWLCDVDRGVYRSTDDTMTAFVLVLHDKAASTLLAARDGRVWVGFVDGSVRSYDGGRADSFSTEHGLPGGTVTAFHEDRRGALWVGTHRGLSRFHDGRFVTLTRKEGLPGPGPVSIVDDADGRLWLGVTGVGILQLTPDEFQRSATDPSHTLRYRLYGPPDGLRGTPVRTFGTPTVTRTNSGHLWFVTGNGLASVDPALATARRSAARLTIESVLANNQRQPPVDRLALPPNTSTLEIDYTLLSLAPLSQMTFRYKLEGFDTQWIEAGPRRQAFYTNVPPGTYRFLVEAEGDESSQSAAAEWQFSILPRFYQTTWFVAALALATATSFWGMWQMRMHQIRKRFSAVSQERARMGRELHDTLL